MAICDLAAAVVGWTSWGSQSEFLSCLVSQFIQPLQSLNFSIYLAILVAELPIWPRKATFIFNYYLLLAGCNFLSLIIVRIWRKTMSCDCRILLELMLIYLSLTQRIGPTSRGPERLLAFESILDSLWFPILCCSCKNKFVNPGHIGYFSYSGVGSKSS